MVETILLFVTFLLFYFNTWTGYWDINIFVEIVIALVLLSICLFIIINRYMKTNIIGPALIIKAIVIVLFMGFYIYGWVFWMTIELRI
jgi:hypothetical protein